MDVMTVLPKLAHSSLPTRESSRKRVPRTLGPDFIQHFPPRSYRARSVEDEKAAHKTVNNKKGDDLTAALKPKSFIERGNVRKGRLARNTRPVPVTVDLLDDGNICRKCQKSGSANGELGGQDTMLYCTGKDCDAYAVHAECWPFAVQGKEAFKCTKCQKCELCGTGKTLGNDTFVNCLKCDAVCHASCHGALADPHFKRGGRHGRSAVWFCTSCKVFTAAKKTVPTKKAPEVAFEPNDVHQNSPIAVPDGATVILQKRPYDYIGTEPTTVRSKRKLLKPKRKFMNGTLKMQNGSHSTQISETGTETSGGHELPERWSSDASVALDKRGMKRKLMEEEDSELHQDLGMWSVKQCDTWFRDSDPELADLITFNEMFGSTLILISRSQFLDLFQLPLGKALRMHATICKWRHLYF